MCPVYPLWHILARTHFRRGLTMRRRSVRPASQRACLGVEELELRAQPAGLMFAAFGSAFHDHGRGSDHGSEPVPVPLNRSAVVRAAETNADTFAFLSPSGRSASSGLLVSVNMNTFTLRVPVNVNSFMLISSSFNYSFNLQASIFNAISASLAQSFSELPSTPSKAELSDSSFGAAAIAPLGVASFGMALPSPQVSSDLPVVSLPIPGPTLPPTQNNNNSPDTSRQATPTTPGTPTGPAQPATPSTPINPFLVRLASVVPLVAP